MGTHNLCFKYKYEKYQNFLSENFHFWVLKFSVYLNRHVFVMGTKVCSMHLVHMTNRAVITIYGKANSRMAWYAALTAWAY